MFKGGLGVVDDPRPPPPNPVPPPLPLVFPLKKLNVLEVETWLNPKLLTVDCICAVVFVGRPPANNDTPSELNGVVPPVTLSWKSGVLIFNNLAILIISKNF